MEDSVDPGVGVTLEAKIGQRVEEGDLLATVHHNSPQKWEAHREALASAWEISDEAPSSPDLVLERIDASTI